MQRLWVVYYVGQIPSHEFDGEDLSPQEIPDIPIGPKTKKQGPTVIASR